MGSTVDATAPTALRAVAETLETVAVDAALVPADRSYLTATASRLRALAASLAAPPRPEPEADSEPPEPPSRTFTRSEVARRARVGHNSLLRWEERGLLRPVRDSRGWRVYSEADVRRARLLARRLPVPDLPDAE